ncbi:MAG TPA: hypothetical protein VFS43_38120, partial [Polyangiaceae bacterium]|nr:hypothetical protein [Polyangiaceae bacterium]
MPTRVPTPRPSPALGGPDDLPPPPPASGPTTPTGTPRPRRRQDTATDYAEARQQLADTGQPARP